MTHDPAQVLIDELDQLLDRERQSLLAGDLDQIARLTTLKETLIDQLDGNVRLDRDRLTHVREKVARNQVLLTGAMQGIRAVADRMVDLRRVRQSLETYDHSGRKTGFATGRQASVEKRA